MRYRGKTGAIAIAALGMLLAAPQPSDARVTKITILSTTPAYGGRVFGAAGAYEEIRGTASGELDPFDHHNAVITDINLAPRNANGKVTYTATFTMLKPVDMSKASGDWAFADCRSTSFPGVADATRICLRNGFDPNLIYELVYTAKDPLVLGVGMAAMRDINSFFRRARAADGNPIAGRIEWAIGLG